MANRSFKNDVTQLKDFSGKTNLLGKIKNFKVI